MNTATTYIAESIVKAVGVAGIEAMAMKNAIYSIWRPLAEELADTMIEVCFDFEGEDIRAEYADSVFAGFRTRMTTDFIEKVLPFIEEYTGYAWDRGREDAFGYALSGLLTSQKSYAERPVPSVEPTPTRPFPEYFLGYGVTSSRIADRLWERWTRWGRDNGEYKFKKDQESIISELVSLTGSTKANVQRTMKRWFEQTQGQYFDRFIVPETARLLSYEQGASLRSIGINYKEFVKAEGYWSSVSEFNAESSKVFAQVQSLHEMNVHTYMVVAVLDEKTCDVCHHMHGSTWSVEEAVVKVYDMLISEADDAYEMSPFPPRSTPKDFENPEDSPYMMPPYHPRCRCNVRSEHAVTAMPQEALARPFDAGPKPTNKLLNRVYNQYVDTPSKQQVAQMVESGQLQEGVRGLSGAEKKVAKEAWESMPLEVKKWSARNKENFQLFIEEGEDITSRVEGNRIFMNRKYFDPSKYGPQPIQHELRHALVDPSIIDARGGGESVWRELVHAAGDTKKGWRSPTHVNTMYQLNGNQGLRAASAASDEFLAMIGDHYQPNMSLSELIDSVRHKSYGISVSDEIGSTVVSQTKRWSAKEAKNATEYWWRTVDVDNHTLMSKKQILAKLNQKPNNAQIQGIAIRNEIDLRDVLRSAGIKKVHQEGDNAPFDVWIGADPVKWYAGTSKVKPTDVIEVKTIVNNSNNKITMSKEALARKRKELRKFGKKNTRGHTVIFDERDGKYYYRDDIGSFRLSAMQEVTLDDLQRKFGGKATGAILEQVVESPKVKVKWETATTLAQARKQLKDKFGIKKVGFKPFDTHWIPPGETTNRIVPAWAGKQAVELLNEIGQAMADGSNKYKWWGSVVGSKTKVGKLYDLDLLEIYPGKIVPGTTSAGEFSHYENSIKVGMSIKDTPGTGRKIHTGAEYFTSGNADGVDLFMHEYGHKLNTAFSQHVYEVGKKYPEVWEWWHYERGLDWVQEDPRKWAISEYGMSARNESFAEAVSIMSNPKYKKGVHKKLEEYVLEQIDVPPKRLKLKTTTYEPDYIGALAEAEAKRKKIKGVPTVPLSKLMDIRPLEEGGINASYTAKMALPSRVKGGKRRVKKVLYKPIKGESWVASDLPPSELGVGSGWDFQGDVPYSLWSEFERQVGAPPDALIRRGIHNLDASLVHREMAALDVAKELKLKNIKFPKTHVVMEKGKPVGIAVEWTEGLVEEVQYATKFASTYKPLTNEQKFEYSVFDYLIGNTDRHNRNVLRNKSTGKTLAIDHGYSFPGQDSKLVFGTDSDYAEFVIDGLDQWKCIPSRSLQRKADDYYPSGEYARILDKIENLDVQGIGRKYGLSRGETMAFEYRRRVVMRLMVDKRFAEYIEEYHYASEFWPVPENFGLGDLNVELWENVTEANI